MWRFRFRHPVTWKLLRNFTEAQWTALRSFGNLAPEALHLAEAFRALPPDQQQELMYYLEDRALMDRADLQESIRQMRAGDYTVLRRIPGFGDDSLTEAEREEQARRYVESIGASLSPQEIGDLKADIDRALDTFRPARTKEEEEEARNAAVDARVGRLREINAEEACGPGI